MHKSVMGYKRFKGVEMESGDIKFDVPYSTKTVIKRIRDLKNHGYCMLKEDVNPSRIKAASMSSETVEGPQEGDFHVQTPEKFEYNLSVRYLIETRLTIDSTGASPSLADFMSMVDLILGPKPRKKQK